MSEKRDTGNWLPTTAKEVAALGWDYIDVILFTGDAYVDHPSFGAAVIGRILQAEGYRVAIVPQPNWRDDLRDFRKLGKPRLFFGVTAGSMDSMVNHYTANIRLRSDDAYTPGGKAGFRPDHAVTVYTKILKSIFPNTPVAIGGIEASLRRLTHYDYWSDSLKPSILVESGADLLMYGMGDRSIIDVAKTLKNGFNAKLLRKLPQVAFLADDTYVERLDPRQTITLNTYEQCLADKKAFAENFVRLETESNRLRQESTLVEGTAGDWVVINPPYPALTEAEIDRSFGLPYTRLPHPRYEGKGTIPAYEMIKHSVNIHRGCFGGCSFCTISAHQGKFITSRSEQSILTEVEKITRMEDFRGYLSDVGGPSANMYSMGGRDTSLCERCTRPSCLYPKMCPNLNNSHRRLLELYKKVSEIKGIKKAFIGSGIRYDLFDKNDRGEYLREVVVNHTSGRLKVAPEHTEDAVLHLMRKPSFDLFRSLNEEFNRVCRSNELKYQLIPYFISSHPGCTEYDMKNLSQITGSLNFRLEQVQDLTPTPMTLSSVMFYTQTDPYSGKPLYVAKSQDDKRKQKSYFFRDIKEYGKTPERRNNDGKAYSQAPERRNSDSKSSSIENRRGSSDNGYNGKYRNEKESNKTFTRRDAGSDNNNKNRDEIENRRNSGDNGYNGKYRNEVEERNNNRSTTFARRDGRSNEQSKPARHDAEKSSYSSNGRNASDQQYKRDDSHSGSSKYPSREESRSTNRPRKGRNK